MHRNGYLLLSLFFLILGVIFFSLAVRQYQVVTSSQAAGETVAVNFSPNQTYGTVNQSFGVIVGDISKETTVSDLRTYFKGKNVTLKLLNPTPEIINSSSFATLQTDGFLWYLAFDNYESMTTTLAAYYAKYETPITVELTKYEAFDRDKTTTLKTTYPKIKFHAAGFLFWPRDKAKDILTKAPPPIVDALSFQTQTTEDGLWQYLKLMFATLFDASSDVAGNSGILMNYPSNSKLSLSRIILTGSLIQNQIRRYSIITSAIVSAVQTQGREGKAPIATIIAGDFEQLNTSERTMLSLLASTIQTKPSVAWPPAVPENGDPWDNTFVQNSNTKPLAGFMSVANGTWYGILFNTEALQKTVLLPQGDYTTYQLYSNIKGKERTITNGNQILLDPYETVMMIPSTISIPSGGGGGSQSGLLECDAGVDPYNSNKIVVKNGTSQAIDKIEVDLFHCKYVPGQLEKYRGSYRCEGGPEACADGAESCFKGDWDSAFSQPKRNIVLQPGESMTFEYKNNACATSQMDVRTMNDGIVQIECHNVQSKDTVKPGEMWPGGYAFAISENSVGYNASTQSCPQPTATPSPNPSDSPTPSPSQTPTSSPTQSPTPSPTRTPTPSPTPSNTPSPSPTRTPTPIPPTPTPIPPTPVQDLTVNEQAPGFNPWFALLIPFGLVALGLAL